MKENIMNKGKSYFIRTVTFHYTGRCTISTPEWVELADAAWIADDGRFNEFLKTGIANEVEPFVCPVRITFGSIVDVTEFKHPLPREVK